MTLDRVVRGDPRLDAYAHVGDPAWLRERGLFVAEGRLIVQRALAAGRHRFESILVTPAAAEALGSELARAVAPVLLCEPVVLRDVTGFNFHRGCLALLERPPAGDLATLASSPGRALLVGLDGVGNPDNTGGIFRSAAAFGAAGVLVGPGTSDPLYRKALRTSMGAVLDLPWASVERWAPVFDLLRRNGFVVAALTPRADAVPVRHLAGAGARLLLLLGSEGAGLPDALIRSADLRVRIPIAPGVDSLNVSVAAGVALHAAAAG